MKHLPHHDLKKLAAMCGGAALLIGISLVLSGSLQLPGLKLAFNANSQAAATALGDTQHVPAPYGLPYTGQSYPADTTCWVNWSYASYGPNWAPLCPYIGNSGWGANGSGFTDIFGTGIFSVDLGGIGQSVSNLNSYTIYVGSSYAQSVAGVAPVVPPGTPMTLEWSCLPSRTVNWEMKSGQGVFSSGGWGGSTLYSLNPLATSVTGSGPGFTLSSGSLFGSQAVTAPSTLGPYNYSLTCNGGGPTITIPVTVGSPVSISANPSSLSSAGNSTLTYAAKSVDPGSCSIKDQNNNVVLSGFGDTTAAPVYLTSGTSWTVPSGWDSTANTVETIGGGGGGGGGDSPSGYGGDGGGGGAYAIASNIPLTPNTPVTYSLGAGGAGGVVDGSEVGGAGGSTYFNGASCAVASVCAGGGDGGEGGNGSGSDGNGGAFGGTPLVGSGNKGGAGGLGGDGTGGGGGAAGPYGAGGSANVTCAADNCPGARGDAGRGGSGAIGGDSTPGGNGTEWDASHGSGGGGGGNQYGPGGAGGYYGAAGGGGWDAGGAGRQGMIRIFYYKPLTVGVGPITQTTTYTIRCTQGGRAVSASATVSFGSPPTATISAGAGNGVAVTGYVGTPVTLTATYTAMSGDTLTATAMTGPNTTSNSLVPQGAPFSPKSYSYTPTATGAYTFYPSLQSVNYPSWNNYGASVTINVVNQDICTDIPGTQSSVPTGCQTPIPSPGQCVPGGKVYDSGSNSCIYACSVASGGGATGTYPSCTCNVSGAVYKSANNSCVQPTGSITQQLQANPNQVRKGGTASLSWATTGMTSCSLAKNGVVFNASAPLSSAGLVSPTVISATTFTLSCSDGTKTYTSSASVTLVPVFQEI